MYCICKFSSGYVVFTQLKIYYIVPIVNSREMTLCGEGFFVGGGGQRKCVFKLILR